MLTALAASMPATITCRSCCSAAAMRRLSALLQLLFSSKTASIASGCLQQRAPASSAQRPLSGRTVYSPRVYRAPDPLDYPHRTAAPGRTRERCRSRRVGLELRRCIDQPQRLRAARERCARKLAPGMPSRRTRGGNVPHRPLFARTSVKTARGEAGSGGGPACHGGGPRRLTYRCHRVHLKQ